MTTGGSGPDGRGGPHVFVADLGAPELDAADAHHLRRVLRRRGGEPLTLSDGRGRWCPAVLGDRGGVEVTGEVVVVGEPEPAVTIGLPPVKGDRPEWAVQKLTEIGVDHVIVLATDRAVVRWEGDRADRHLDRLRRVAREAAMQSRRVRLPTIEGPRAVADLMTAGAALADLAAPGAPTLDTPTVLIGPEGGWSDGERARAGVRVGLSSTVLRVETAALVAATVLTGLRDGRFLSHVE